MKSRFSSLDIRILVNELRSKIVGFRVANIYDVNSKTYLFKLVQTGVAAVGQVNQQIFLLSESGNRFHTTEYDRDRSPMPNDFSMKLRKHIRTHRISGIRQVGVDRIIEISFTSGYLLYFEFFAGGNIILTNPEHQILALLRMAKPDENTRFAVRETYDISRAHASLTPVSRDSLMAILRSAGPDIELRRLLLETLAYGSSLIDHCITKAGLEPSMNVVRSFDMSPDSASFDNLLAALQEANTFFEGSQATTPGYIFTRANPSPRKDPDGNLIDEELFESFEPFLFEHLKDRPHRVFDTFDKALDEYFSRIDGQRVDQRAARAQQQSLNRVAHVRKDHENRLQALRAAQVSNVERARLIEANVDLVDAARQIVLSALASGFQWSQLWELVVSQKDLGHPVARCIHALRLETSQIDLSLPIIEEEEEDAYDSDEDFDNEEASTRGSKKRRMVVTIDLGVSAFANAQNYYQLKKSSHEKELRTISASSRAIRSTERLVRQEIQQVQVASAVNRMRKPYWFERFAWFISTENYLVIAGRDAQQNEILVKRYLRPGDAYIHADIHGATSVIVKNPFPDQPVSPVTLSQAGTMAICLSSAWDANIVVSAWWVEANQVSKTAPSGEYLPTGSFVIRGKKNFLPPARLEMGFGYMFRLDDESVPRHRGERKMNLSKDDIEAYASSVQRYGLQASDTSAETPASESVAESSAESSAELDLSKVDFSNITDDTGFARDADASPEDSDQEAGQGAEAADRDSISSDEDEEAAEEIAAPSAPEPTSSKKKQTAASKKKQAAASKKPSREESPPPAKVRGKHGKMKKLKKKYADQDDEERELRMELLGSTKGANQKAAKRQEEIAKRQEKVDRANRPRVKAPVTSLMHVPASGADGAENAAAPATLTEEQERQEVRQLLAAEQIPLDDDEEAELSTSSLMGYLDALTGVPHPDDILLYAVPVCLPYTVALTYKFKVKVTPGSLKKGKACKATLDLVEKHPDMTRRERDLLRAVPTTEAVAQMIGKARISPAAGDRKK
ncbi:hypothetical protein H696_01086 [Fonticula alba]|uniref:Ribosome quality control complex subunit 2 n=1 Tax=Fonticula alba TaxID=691883 RepID=A0A058ZB68_FONAL|nr:hypothetical protein H696_01086 [Fonticula alba]KCV71670.1 hypothetical protein H696_01086 [Fonticula alba]|eukprot:XP_009493248.1 hypothetical protein H696_01086 [Fonticula alba]